MDNVRKEKKRTVCVCACVRVCYERQTEMDNVRKEKKRTVCVCACVRVCACV